MIQCRNCNEWGHFARDCQSGQGNGGKLCKWCRPGDHEDTDCPKQKGSINMLEVADEEVLAITRAQSKRANYPDPRTEKERFREAKTKVAEAMANEGKNYKATSTLLQSESEKNIVRQVLHTTIPIKVTDLLQTMPSLKVALTNAIGENLPKSSPERTPEVVAETSDPMLLTVSGGN